MTYPTISDLSPFRRCHDNEAFLDEKFVSSTVGGGDISRKIVNCKINTN